MAISLAVDKSAIKQGFAELPTKAVGNFVGILWAEAVFAVESGFSLKLHKK
ncbi:hypothetical protein ACLD9W_01020 [Neisseria sp. WLZKY-1]|uniref:hypothetical protein n=1 Tax=Neisseria sp. WLZKY-1 TaxID=3390377 RepID=UPI00397C9602